MYKDKGPRYFSEYETPRIANPYVSIADKITETYAKGDTIVYPSKFLMDFGGKYMPTYSVVDAQLVNFYLPKEAEYIQRVDPNEPDRVFQIKQDGSKIELFNSSFFLKDFGLLLQVVNFHFIRML